MPDSDDYTGGESESEQFQPLVLSYEPDFFEILKGVLNVTKSEARTYFSLLRLESADVRSLADERDRAESTVREQLATLRETELVTRDKRVAKSGLSHVYQTLSPEEAKSELRKMVDRWVIRVAHRIDILGENSPDESHVYRSIAANNSMVDIPEQTSTDEYRDSELPSLRSIATCVFGFSYPELELYLVLLDNPRSTAQELAEEQNLARTTVVGRLNILQDRGLAHPVAKTTEVGNSTAYAYVPRPLNEVKRAMTKQLQSEWIESAHYCINDFELPPPR